MYKKLLMLAISLITVMSGYSQMPDTSPDFTGTSIHGETINLYSILDQGKYVWIHTTGSF